MAMGSKLVLVGATTLLIGGLVGFRLANQPSSMTFDDQTGGNGKGQMNQNQSVTRENCLADDCLLVDGMEYPAGTLPTEVKEALDEAILDEYKARATYEAVIASFGSNRPFSMIVGAESQHIASLEAIYDKYGESVPADTISVTAPKTLEEACQIGVDAEIANAALYQDTLIPAVVDYPDITAVFTSLMNASSEKHLPAFERCN